jgi:hypothetical protein
VEGLKARVERRKSAPVLAWKGASGTHGFSCSPHSVLAIRATDTPQTSKRSLSHCAAAAATVARPGNERQGPYSAAATLLLQ